LTLVKIEPNINFFAFLILLGVIQGLILSYFFLSKKNRIHQPNIFIGLLILNFSLTSFDIFLCYTGYMANMAYLDNFTESFTFAVGPLFYMYVISSLRGKIKTRHLLHLLPFAFYSVYNILYIIQSTAFKKAEYISSYFPDIPVKRINPRFNTDPFYLREYLSEITILYLLIYIAYSFLVIVKAFKKEKVSIFAGHYKNLSWLRNFTFSLIFVLLVLIFVKISFGRDIGDYLVISCIALIIYGTSAYVIRSSLFFTEHLSADSVVGKKYAKSSLSEEDKFEILKKLKESMENEKYYKNNLVSQTQISKKLLIPSHHISQVINEKLNQTFFEFIAMYRIREAERILSDPANHSLTIEDVAEEVGYISKSAFNKTFKKITGKTPSEYRI
jgi:AraC-like DNA-binding protein